MRLWSSSTIYLFLQVELPVSGISNAKLFSKMVLSGTKLLSRWLESVFGRGTWENVGVYNWWWCCRGRSTFTCTQCVCGVKMEGVRGKGKSLKRFFGG